MGTLKTNCKPTLFFTSLDNIQKTSKKKTARVMDFVSRQRATSRFWLKIELQFLQHPPHLLDLVPYDFWHFPKLKNPFKDAF